jgi:hypothetical protein
LWVTRNGGVALLLIERIRIVVMSASVVTANVVQTTVLRLATSTTTAAAPTLTAAVTTSVAAIAILVVPVSTAAAILIATAVSGWTVVIFATWVVRPVVAMMGFRGSLAVRLIGKVALIFTFVRRLFFDAQHLFLAHNTVELECLIV